MANAEIIICVLCAVAFTAECRYIPQQTLPQYQVPRGQFHSTRRTSSDLHNGISPIRRNLLKKDYASRAKISRQYQINPTRRHDSFDSIIKQSVQNLHHNAIFRNRIRNPKRTVGQSQSVGKLPNGPRDQNRKRKLSVHLKFNGQTSGDSISKNVLRNIQINANNIRNLKLSNAIKGSDILIKKQGRKTRIHILGNSKSQMKSRTRNIDVSPSRQEKQTSIIAVARHVDKAEVNKINERHPISHVNYLPKGSNKKPSIRFDTHTLNPKAWIITTLKPSTHISSEQTTSSVTSTSDTVEIFSRTASQITSKSTRKTASNKTPTVLSTTQTPLFLSTITEEIDLPDVPDLPEVSETSDATDATHAYSYSNFD